jgi:hypothetical protein
MRGVGAGQETAKVRIDTLEAVASTLGRRQLRLVLAWAELHQRELLENWRLARADLAPDTLYERVRTGSWPDEDVAA